MKNDFGHVVGCGRFMYPVAYKGRSNADTDAP